MRRHPPPGGPLREEEIQRALDAIRRDEEFKKLTPEQQQALLQSAEQQLRGTDWLRWLWHTPLPELVVFGLAPQAAVATIPRRVGLGLAMEGLRQLVEPSERPGWAIAQRGLIQAALEALTRGGLEAVARVRGTRTMAPRLRAWERQVREFPEIAERERLGYVKQIADGAKALVPSWRGIPSTDEGLLQIAVGEGRRRLIDMYGRMLEEVKDQIPAGHQTSLPARLVARLTGSRRLLEQVPPDAPVPLPTSDLIDLMRGIKDPGVKLATLDRLVRSLDDVSAGLGARYLGARQEYWAGRGIQEHLLRTKALQPDPSGQPRLDPARVLKGLMQPPMSVEAHRRGLDVMLRPHAPFTAPPPKAPILPRGVEEAPLFGGMTAWEAREALRAGGVPWPAAHVGGAGLSVLQRLTRYRQPLPEAARRGLERVIPGPAAEAVEILLSPEALSSLEEGRTWR
jgi:hypothetical protein